MADEAAGGDITEHTMGNSMVGFAERLSSTDHQDSGPDSLRVTGWMAITIPIPTTVCAKDGFQLGAITRKADKTPIPAFGIRFRCRTDIGKLFPAISPVLL
jgi:hypothetical protein